ncbi:MAG: cupin domain-containing protein [Acidobacteria bacterium]|nr:cupin domain-containing protein [Acidobacteriota bacterium]
MNWKPAGWIVGSLVAAAFAAGPVDPTWLRKHVPEVQAVNGYKPLFEGERVLRSVVRYGELVGSQAEAALPNEERIYVVAEGKGEVVYQGAKRAVRAGDFFYCAPGAKHALNGSGWRVVVMGFKASPASVPPELPVANLEEIRKQTVAGHPPTVLYQLMIGDTKSTRDRLAVAQTVTSLYVMEFEPGGTNAPHHHEDEEEIYYLMDGKGEMVAGSGMDGLLGKYEARPGDAYFFRKNCTVGFYADSAPGAKAHILAVRSRLAR